MTHVPSTGSLGRPAPADRSALPPGPRMPATLQTALWVRRAQWMLGQCARRFGDTFTLRIAGQGTWVVVSHPRDVETVFKADPQIARAGEGNRVLEPVLGPNSVLLLDGRAHLRERRLMLPAFHGTRMAAYRGLIAEIARAEIDRWPRGEVQRLRPRMQALTLEVILQAVLGVTDPRRREELRVALRRLLAMGTDPRWGSLFVVLGPERLARFGPFRRVRDPVDRLLYAEIAERRAAGLAGEAPGAGADIMSMLLAARYEDGSPMGDEELRDELITLLVAGHETTANALAWAGERLARHPEALARLAEESRAGTGTTYVTAVIQETLRLRPVISIVQRVLAAPLTVGEYELPAGIAVVPALYLVGRRADVYPDPERFDPDRFLRQPPGTYTWIPFGGGVRRCLGAAFAQFEMETVLHELAARAHITAVRAPSEPVLRRAVTETPRHDALVLVD
jgi:cytochrome P450 family 135